MRTLLALVAAAALAASCQNAPTAPTNTTPARVPQYFSGVLNPGESAFYSFTVAATADTDVTLVSLLPNQAASPALAIPMSIGLGTPAGTDCRTSSTVTTPPGLSPQVTGPTTATISSSAASIYCARIADIGKLTGPVAFIVKIVHP